jgi:hypothetical protein
VFPAGMCFRPACVSGRHVFPAGMCFRLPSVSDRQMLSVYDWYVSHALRSPSLLVANPFSSLSSCRARFLLDPFHPTKGARPLSFSPFYFATGVLISPRPVLLGPIRPRPGKV